jgi:hypothetical protein
MERGILARLLDREPALLTAAVTSLGGFVAQAGPGHIQTLKALGTSLTVGGLQGIVTRGRVISPATHESGDVSSVLGMPSTWLAQGAEPALAMSLVGFLAGFLVQVVGGAPDLLQALGISVGLAGTQGVLTRQQVFSPQTVALELLSAGSAGLGGLLATGRTPRGSSPAAAAVPAPAAAQAAPAPPPPAVAVHDPDLDVLLNRYRPEIRYDSLESFFADSAAVITDRLGNLLKRQDGSVIAPVTGGPPLTLDFLRPGRYPTGAQVEATDYVDEVGTDYVAQARQMHEQAKYANFVHGRVVRDGAATLWLQYWLFYYYDDPGFLGFGTHEGDIEMIQLRLDADRRPDAASYSQHRSGLRAAWDQLERGADNEGEYPITYSARGSHANLVHKGTQFSDRSPIPDHNDGDGGAIRLALIPLSDTGTPWSLWPGTWGSTRPHGFLGDIGIEANSPLALKRHLAWNDPARFHASCEQLAPDAAAGAARIGPPPPPPPALSVEQPGDATVVRYQVADPVPADTKIVVGLVSKTGSRPAITTSANVRDSSGTVELPKPLAGYDEVRATVQAPVGAPSETAVAPL